MVARLAFAALLLTPFASHADEIAIAGRVVAAHGQSSVLHAHKLTPLKRGDTVYQGDEVETADDGGVRILLQDNSVLDIGANSDMKLDAFTFKPKTQTRLAKITMLIGKLWARVTPSLGGEQNFNVATPNAVAGVRGTSLVVDVSNKGSTQVTVVNGQVAVHDNVGGNQVLGPMMQSTVTNKGQTVNPQVTSSALNQLKSSTSIKPNLGSEGSSSRLQVATTLVNTTPAGGRDAGPASRAPQGPRDISTTTPTAPPIDLDPSKNLATVTVNVHVKE